MAIPGALNLSGHVRNPLLKQVNAGHLKPGGRTTEAKLRRTPGISRNPIRKAIGTGIRILPACVDLEFELPAATAAGAPAHRGGIGDARCRSLAAMRHHARATWDGVAESTVRLGASVWKRNGKRGVRLKPPRADGSRQDPREPAHPA